MYLTSLPPDISSKGIKQRNKEIKIKIETKKASSYPTVRAAESHWFILWNLEKAPEWLIPGTSGNGGKRQCAKLRAGWKLFGSHLDP